MKMPRGKPKSLEKRKVIVELKGSLKCQAHASSNGVRSHADDEIIKLLNK